MLAALRGDGRTVHAVSRRREPGAGADGIVWHRCDLLQPGAATRLAADVKAASLVHLAWHVEASGVENYRWVGASLELVDAFRDHGGRRALVAGSCAEYDWSAPQPLGEGARRRPATAYGIAKDALYRAFEGYCAETGLSGVWGRIFFVYGPGEPERRLVPTVVRALLAGEPARTSHGRQLRDYLYVADLAAAVVATVDSEVTGAINLASGDALALRDLIGVIADQLDGRDHLAIGAIEARPDEAAEVRADVTRLRDAVGWRPGTSIDDGVAETIAWWRRRAAR